MPGPNDPTVSGFNFGQMVANSRVVPEMPQGAPSAGAELPPSVRQHVPKQPFMQPNVPEDKPGPQIMMMHHSRVFVLWRPWEICDRCSEMIASNQATLPPLEGDLECPHNTSSQYKAIMDRGLAGDFIIALKDPFTMPDGTRCVHVEWMEPDKNQMAAAKKEAEDKKANQVYPPDVNGAFSNGKK